MRCALVALELGVGLAGVDKAMAGQARAAKELGAPLDVIVVGQNGTGSGAADGVRYVRFDTRWLRLGRLSRLVKARLLASVPALLDYDAVFLRYPTAIDLDPLRFLRRARGRVATVHHAKEPSELLAVARTSGGFARVAIERLQGYRVLRRVHGIVGVTDEIRDYEVARAGTEVPSRTISNGVDVERIRQTGFVHFDGRELRLALIASAQATWHGTDRLFSALKRHRGPPHVVVDLIGHGSRSSGELERLGEAASVRVHGPLHGAALDAVMRDATLGVSTLAFHRTGLRQGAVLKTREYVARGLPVVLAYEDVDLPDDCPFVLRLPGDDAPIEVGDLVAFAEHVSAQAELPKMMRAFARDVLDWRAKIPRFTAFATELLDLPQER